MSQEGSPFSGNYPFLQEYPIESNFLHLIPAKAQRGLATFDLELTCLDADGFYIAIGSNVGVVYLFNREKGCMHKLKDKERRSSVTCVKVLISLECLIAVGCRDGAVLVYKVPFQENEEFEKFTVDGLHECSITALEWAKNGMKFFSGDESGAVVCTEIDHLEHQSRSRLLMNEKNKIVQLSYSHLNLLISTLFRSLVYSLQTNTTHQIGQKERKCFGPFGAIIIENGSTSTVFAARPGQRLWKSDLSGVIQETMIFKSALMTSHPTIQVLAKSNENPCFTDFQFERLARYEDFVLIWCDSYILLIDPNQKLIVATSPKLDPITDVATCNKEIFILRGLRHIMRISLEPDAYSSVKVTEEPSVFEEILEPFKGLSTYVKERSDSLAVPKTSNPLLFDWLKKKRSVSTPPDISDDAIKNKGTEAVSADLDPLPAIVNLGASDCIPVQIRELSTTIIDKPELVKQDYTKIGEPDDIVFKVKRKNKKHRKVHFDIDAAPKREKFKSKSHVENNSESQNNQSKQVDESEKYLDNNKNSKLENSDSRENLQSKELGNAVEIPSSGSDVSSTFDFNTSHEPISNTLLDNVSIKSTDNTIENSNLSNVKMVQKDDIDGDRLLEDVLSAYSSLKQQNSCNDNSLESQNDSNPVSKCCDSNQNELVSNLNARGSNHPNLTLKISSSEVTEMKNFCEDKSPDADEVYSSSKIKEILKVNTPDESMDSISCEDSSSSSLDSRKDEPPKYGVDWVEYKAPELLLDLSVSSDHLFCVDVRNQLYFTKLPRMGSLHWIQLGQPAEKVATSDSESVVWTLYRGTIFAAIQKAASLWQNTEWISVARDVVSIAVDDTCGWYAKSNGELVTQQNLSVANPYSYPETVPCNSPALQVAAKNGVLWVLSMGGSLLTKKITEGKISKSKWKEIVLKDVPGIDSIFLGSQKTGWIMDSDGIIRFIIGVTPDAPEGTGKPWIVESSNFLFRPTTQLEQVVRRALNSEALTNLIRGKQHLCLSTSDIGIWFCKTYDNLLYSNQKCVIGHSWELVVPPSTAVATKWSLIAADGLINSNGALWCVNSNGELFCYITKTQNLVPVELPAISGIRCLQPKYETLWFLSEDGAIYVRRGITPNCLQGIWWQALDLMQLASQEIIHITCSSFLSWACTSDGEILMRLGSLNPSDSKLNQAWISIGTANEEATSPLVKVYVGPMGYPVWALDRNSNVYAREGVTPNLPIGEKWMSVPDLHAKDLCITNNAVWLLRSSGKIYRRFGVTEKNPCGDYWKEMPGNLDYLSATEDDDLWGLQNGSMFCHYSFALYNMANSSNKLPARMISEDDWEDIMADDDFDDDS